MNALLHPSFRSCRVLSPGACLLACDLLAQSKYLAPLVATTALLKKDLLLKLQLQRHSFVKLTHLDIPTDPPPCNDMVLSVAAAELRRMNQARSRSRVLLVATTICVGYPPLLRFLFLFSCFLAC